MKKISVEYQRTSTYVYDMDWDWSETKDDKEIIHLAIRCRHDWIEVIEGTVVCMDCNNKHLTRQEELAFILADRSPDDDDDDYGRGGWMYE